jgi:nitrite reductase/ring-hydroxylating ferredoxin subunit
MSTITAERVRVGSVAELEQRGCTVISAGGHGIAVFAHDGQFFAVDNRCPHMGFPLSRGTVRDGLLTCHWHHARFDLDGGGTLDPFADNVRCFAVDVEGDAVFLVLDERATEDRAARWLSRLEEGLEHQLDFVLAKACIALPGGGTPAADVIRTIGRYGLRYRARGWGQGMTILTAVGWLLPVLAPEDRPLALFHGAVHVASDTAGAPRFELDPLPATSVSLERLKVWFRRAVEVRDEDGAERILQTAIAAGASPTVLADMLFAAATDHLYLDAGHVLDFINKACEYLDLVGWTEAHLTLPTLVTGLCTAQRSEEQNAWRNPIDLVELLDTPLAQLARLSPGERPLGAESFDALVTALLDDDPAAGLSALTSALGEGAAPAEAGQAVAHAAALRIGRFHTSNEFSDWDAVHNTWTSCQALARALVRAPSLELARGLYHAAMRIYLDRFLNVPAARLPDERPASMNGHAGRPEELFELLDREQQVAAAARVVDAAVAAGDADRLIRVLSHALLREDAEFHGYQTLEAGVRQYTALRADHPLAARRTLASVSRYIAAHAPTPRAMHQTYQIAVRLLRGDDLTVAVEE